MLSKILAIIPARGGSKGVSRKNIRLFAGKPLIAYAIEAALGSKVIERVLVSTEDDEIRSVAEKHGAEAVKRPQELASDTAKTEPVMIHALEVVEQGGYHPDYVSLIQCTSPFLTEEIIRKATSKLVENPDRFDSCATFYKPNAHFRWKYDEESELFVSEYPVENRPLRQDMEQEYPYVGAGAFYIVGTELFKKTKNRVGGNSARITGILMNEEDAIQIDTESDFLIAEERMKKKRLDNQKSFN